MTLVPPKPTDKVEMRRDHVYSLAHSSKTWDEALEIADLPKETLELLQRIRDTLANKLSVYSPTKGQKDAINKGNAAYFKARSHFRIRFGGHHDRSIKLMTTDERRADKRAKTTSQPYEFQGDVVFPVETSDRP